MNSDAELLELLRETEPADEDGPPRAEEYREVLRWMDVQREDEAISSAFSRRLHRAVAAEAHRRRPKARWFFVPAGLLTAVTAGAVVIGLETQRTEERAPVGSVAEAPRGGRGAAPAASPQLSPQAPSVARSPQAPSVARSPPAQLGSKGEEEPDPELRIAPPEADSDRSVRSRERKQPSSQKLKLPRSGVRGSSPRPPPSESAPREPTPPLRQKKASPPPTASSLLDDAPPGAGFGTRQEPPASAGAKADRSRPLEMEEQAAPEAEAPSRRRSPSRDSVAAGAGPQNAPSSADLPTSQDLPSRPIRASMARRLERIARWVERGKYPEAARALRALEPALASREERAEWAWVWVRWAATQEETKVAERWAREALEFGDHGQVRRAQDFLDASASP